MFSPLICGASARRPAKTVPAFAGSSLTTSVVGLAGADARNGRPIRIRLALHPLPSLLPSPER